MTKWFFFQGSTFSGLMFLIYTLDICNTTHNKQHMNNISEKCTNKLSNNVDDIFAVIMSSKDKLLNDINEYIIKINK